MKRIVLLSLILSTVLLFNVSAQGDQDTGATEKYVLKLAHVLPTDHLNHKTALKFGEMVKERTNGQVEIEVYPASQLGNEKEITDAVAMGTLDFALCGFGEVAKRYSPALIFDGPFIFRDREHQARVYKSEVFDELMDEMESVGIAMVSPGYYGTRHVTTTDTKVMTPVDLNGKKLRCPDQPMFVGVTTVMGATPTPMAFAEVYLALQQGVADGQENPAAAITSMKFYEVQNYLVKTGHIIQGNHVFGSTKTLAKLPEDIRQVIDEVGAEVSEWAIQESFRIEDELLAGLASKGMTIIEPDLDAFVAAAQPLYDEYESKWGEGLLEKIRTVK
ncbi:MAG: sialic acid TRAP transporter substrate-binding protein SiaP [Spirochaetales bacterium]|nr:sialic acid TRAP transporter substrate-binding protein SiaP [Spirochaetales bacterium]